MKQYNLITFDVTQEAILAEKILKENNLEVKIISLPSEVSASCGFSLMISINNFDKSISVLIENKIRFSDKYFVEKNGLKKSYKKI